MRRLLIVAAVLGATACAEQRPPADASPGASVAGQPGDTAGTRSADTVPLQADSVMARDTASGM